MQGSPRLPRPRGRHYFRLVRRSLETRQNICSRWEAANNALSSISGESCIAPLREFKGGTFALEWLPYITNQSTNPAWLKP
jgi:hypothetical protein